jgi:cyclic beta-1,2-glucan synthetase
MSRMFARGDWRNASSWNDSQTISAEIFGLERSRQHARSLAESQIVTDTPPAAYSIIQRLDDNAKVLLDAYREICGAIADGRSVTPAADWLIDNYHIVEEQIQQTRADLPPGFYRQLPKLAGGPLAGHPRIFGLVWAYVAHSDSRFDPATLTDFVNEYQQVQALSIGELWAVAISLRLILIENLRRISERILQARRDRDAADVLADKLLQLGDPQSSFQQFLQKNGEPRVTQQFTVQLIQKLRDHNHIATEALDWLKKKTEALGYSFESAVVDEHHRQGAANVTVRNIVTSMRLISDVNWEVWFDSVSLVDKLLRTSPNYAAMDFASRTIYRTAVEELARGSGRDELDIAQQALNLNDVDAGYHLIGRGRRGFEKTLEFRPPPLQRLRSLVRTAGLRGYLSGILLFASVGLMLGGLLLRGADISTGALIAILLLAALPASEFGLSVINYAVTRLMDAAVIPGFALRDGVPPEWRSLVVVPTLLTSRDDIEELIDRLEVHYLSNADGEIYFALLTDWTDAETETVSQDAALLNEALNGISRLNARHETDRFLLLHRGRKWNAKQNRWMGWERKRGKLHELNRLLRGAEDTSFIVIGGKLPADVKLVITLDADTRLPRDAARRLVGKLAHPLNKAQYDVAKGRVVSGFSVLQPRVSPSLPVGHNGSLFQRIFSTPRGIDPYVFAVSDVYQDLFGEGSFAGKGIYEIDAFEQALADKIPENTMLSHDLFEGVFARAALVTDIEVVEEFPERYGVAAARQHRWTRGDWQLLPWMLGQRGQHMSAIGLWKMIDNLRRSLVPVATLLALLAGLAVLPFGFAVKWTLFILALGILPPLLPIISDAVPKSMPLTILSRVKAWLDDFGHVLALAGANLLFLGHMAGLMIDAISRTIYRLYVSRRKLLEWTTAAQSESGHRPGIVNSYRLMTSSIIAGLLAISVGIYGPTGNWILSLPLAIAWLAAPALSFSMSRSPQLEDALAASPEDRRSLRLVALRTWRFFETFVTAQENFLPPDNFQEQPKPVVAHRTSPTNVGLYLLSVASAREFGWLGRNDATAKLEATLATVQRLEKYNGHLYNWYDTTDLRPLDPKYVSTVDSGNLAGHLIALSNYCAHWAVQPSNALNNLEGIADILDVITADLAAIPNDRRGLRPVRKQLERQIATLHAALKTAAETPETVLMRMVEFGFQAANIHATIVTISTDLDTPQSHQMLQWADSLRLTIESHFRDVSAVEAVTKKRLQALSSLARSLALAMEFAFLLDPKRLLLSIGYRVAEAMRDESCYDLLASEARLASYYAIAKGDLRTRHWFRLGRTVTAVKGGAALVSWSGSMFEYLMPSLVMRAPGASLLDQTAHLVVDRQISYAARLGIPWGISESAFNARDIEFTYQYSNFGVPGLGLKRGLSGNKVIAPYATGLAAMVAPRAAAENYRVLEKAGGRGDFGFYEAMDYTPSRLRKDQAMAVVQAYFAHHQGMTIVAIFNAVKNGEMRDQFHAEPMIRATELLLQERASRHVPLTFARSEETDASVVNKEEKAPAVRMFDGPGTFPPVTHLLSNGQYHVMLTAAGSGYSHWKGLSITRWREDGVRDDWGSYIYLRDIKTGKSWSAGHMPIATPADSYAVQFAEDKAEFVRKDGNFTTTMECVVSPEDDAEARRVTVTNNSLSSRDVELTTYTELVLANQAADMAHPAFSKMFVKTEYVAEHQAVLATRRRRSHDEKEVWVGQFMLIQGQPIGVCEYETDRGRFLGMGRDTGRPQAMDSLETLSQSVGSVLDPVFCLRQRLRVPAGRLARCTLWTVIADSRDAALALIDRRRQPMAYDRAAMLAWTQAQIQLRHLAINIELANHFQTLAGHLIYANQAMRSPAKILAAQMGSQSALWRHGISGDRPILLLRIDDIEDILLVNQILQGFEYWAAKGLHVDVVLLNDRMSSYVQDLQNSIEELVRKTNFVGHVGQVIVLRADLVSPETLLILPAVARVVLHGRRGDLASQLQRMRLPELEIATPAAAEPQSIATVINTSKLEFFNGFGGFGADGREYVIIVSADRPTPAPWINVVANASFGFQVSADGGGYTWFQNSRENQLTQWRNDAVANRCSEAVYVQDEATGVVMSPALSPVRSTRGTHVARHGFGYTVFERNVHDLQMELVQFVPLDDTIKLSRLKLTNRAAAKRSFIVTAYVEWMLGASGSTGQPFITTMMDDATNVLAARNPWRVQDGQQVAFLDMEGKHTSWTADRAEFLGAHGNLATPLALINRHTLSKRTGAGMEPCAALQRRISLAPGETQEVVISLGAASSLGEARALVLRYRGMHCDVVLKGVEAFWRKTLNVVQVKTPDRSFDLLINGWLLYQTLACRMWARSGFYQASGAYGFRDQLQDSMALLSTKPDIARAHILRAAARQFSQGDFQHWWLPATGMGVRTRISDDTVWLAHCVAHYLKTTGDDAILNEQVSFLDGQALIPGEHDVFFQPATTEETATLYDHCVRGLEQSLTRGEHGLPLIGTGDWNDGMNRVGEAGKGESIWLGWFLLTTLKEFSLIANRRGDEKKSAAWLQHAASLVDALETHGWDGDWYRRGYFDDGSPLGSAQSAECRIDAIAQSWAVLSDSAKPERALMAMERSFTDLVRPGDKLALLFTPPFDKTEKDPGYIKAYPPGIRENGGQYTHGVIWSIFAHAKLGQVERANQLFSLINPINHALNEADASVYRVEPYVIAADVYSVAPHVGRGGWTWYTGSAGWMYRAGIEAILGITREASQLRIKPCINDHWQGFEYSLQHGTSRYEILVQRASGQRTPLQKGVKKISNGEFLVQLKDDGTVHHIALVIGAK